jgi:hypothetical protein
VLTPLYRSLTPLGRGAAVATASGFDPSQIPGLKLWLKADGAIWQDAARTTAAAADGDPVGAWDDGSGLANHATQATSTKRPTLKLAVLNGRPVLRFDGVDDLLTTAAVVTGVADNFSMACVLVPSTLSTNGISACYNGTGASNGWGLSHSTGNGQGKVGWLRGGLAWDSTGTAGATAAQALILVRDAGVATAYKDGAALSPTFAGAPNAPTGVTRVGNHDPSSPYQGDVAECLVYAAALTAGQRASLADYFRSRWGTP